VPGKFGPQSKELKSASYKVDTALGFNLIAPRQSSLPMRSSSEANDLSKDLSIRRRERQGKRDSRFGA
jgi:hypothetical protein